MALYTGIGATDMPGARYVKAEDLQAYIEDHLKSLSVRLIDIATEAIVGEKSIVEQRDFEDHIDRRLRNGSKFIPRKRQPR